MLGGAGAGKAEPRPVSIFLAGRKRQSLLASPITRKSAAKQLNAHASGMEAEWPRLQARFTTARPDALEMGLRFLSRAKVSRLSSKRESHLTQSVAFQLNSMTPRSYLFFMIYAS
ncbi:hypothetical protein A3843_16270 [Pseudovibrio exalbescens]|uniref:Uncharacterized protein n=1 Tax=Pseudovibrio exalbescens TaxID=197461 RepID=A0A1U7JE06_9HYPH|nr:hypothetical protein A3843_16270 [Pseudovibrio exalbescens]